MAIQSSFYTGTALDSRTFPSTKHIPTKQHMAVWRQQVSDDVWVQMSIGDYQLINNACTLNSLLSQALYKQLEVRVADEPDELVSSPSDIALVASIADEIVIVAGIDAEVVIVAGDSAVIDTVAGDTLVINIVAGDTLAVNIVADDTVALNLVSDDLAKGIGTNQPTDSAILNALTNATQTIADVVLTHADVVITNGDVVITNADVVLTHADVVVTNADVLLTNADVVSSGTNATNAELSTWEAEAEKMTADSYATQPEDEFVIVYTSDGDGTFTATPTTENSSLHWAAKSLAFQSPNFGFKNYIANGSKRVNQRGYADGVLADGVYGYDRWKGADSDANREQIIEQQNIISGTYTISFNGGGTATVAGTSGLSSGDDVVITVSSDISVKVPKAATNIQLEEGSVTTPFEQRPYALELSLCQRYYEVSSSLLTLNGHGNVPQTNCSGNAWFKARKRVTPTVIIGGAVNLATLVLGTIGVDKFIVTGTTASASLPTMGTWTADAEL